MKEDNLLGQGAGRAHSERPPSGLRDSDNLPGLNVRAGMLPVNPRKRAGARSARTNQCEQHVPQSTHSPLWSCAKSAKFAKVRVFRGSERVLGLGAMPR